VHDVYTTCTSSRAFQVSHLPLYDSHASRLAGPYTPVEDGIFLHEFQLEPQFMNGTLDSLFCAEITSVAGPRNAPRGRRILCYGQGRVPFRVRLLVTKKDTATPHTQLSS
jgi:hypothetical protein